jgi:hypothetical protein
LNFFTLKVNIKADFPPIVIQPVAALSMTLINAPAAIFAENIVFVFMCRWGKQIVDLDAAPGAVCYVVLITQLRIELKSAAYAAPEGIF